MKPVLSIVVPVVDRAAAPDASRLVPDGASRVELLLEQAASFGEALSRGFARASGDVLGFLGPGARLLPGAVDAIASEVRPESGRRVVMGRAAIVVEGVEGVAVAHPAEYLGHEDHLRIWERRFDSVAYSSLFWHREALGDVGMLGTGTPEAVAFDLACRLGRRNEVRVVEALWSACRVPAVSARADHEILEELIAVSRGYWGGWLSPRRWRCEMSYRRYAAHAHDRSRHHARRAEAARAHGDTVKFWWEYARTWLDAPQMARERLRRP
jgi:hypothetical protein